MAPVSKSSARRSKPNYLYNIIGVSLVLLLLGIMGWIFLNFQQASNLLKEDIRMSAYLRTLNKDTIAQIQQYIASQPYAKNVQYIDKEKAKAIWNETSNEEWDKILDYNPLPESIDFYAKANYVNKDSLQKISTDLMSRYGNQITDLVYPQMLVNTINEKATTIGLVSLAIAIVLCIIVIISIDNTTRLAMFSNRFLIKTMQMVGATRQFISQPMERRAMINGLISSAIAIAILFGVIQWAESIIPQLKLLRNTQITIILFGGMVVIGVIISVFSTHRSVIKYLKMKLDELY
jgi:cell division transport system permease protein